MSRKSHVPASEYEQLAFHPYNVMLVLLMAAIGMLFLGIMGAWVYNRVQADLPSVHVPWLFYPNTLLLAGASWAMERARKAYRHDDAADFLRKLRLVLILSVAFLVSQAIAWYLLFVAQLDPAANNSMGYLYALSGLHFVHVLGGLPFLAWYLFRCRKRLRAEADQLVFFSDAEQRLRLRLLAMYWHFLDALWVILLLVL
ncbi:MAG: heme-copper oxidase subunit III, partial [Bacteroidetes bacterium]